ncbi:MAG TPA: hypothetical protein VFQ35_24730, partial [Polyangiaceae bacterium]|nr:hypothetical protein [Polyangiaceae bacterium]
MAILLTFVFCQVVAAVASAQDANGGAPATSALAAGAPASSTPPGGQKEVPEGRVEVAGTSGADSAAPKELQARIDSDDFEYRIAIAEVERRPVKTVEILADPLLDEKGKQRLFDLGVEGAPMSHDSVTIAKPLGAGDRRTLIVRARLPELGTYTMTLTPYWGGAPRQKIVLKIVRERPTLGLEVADATTFAQSGDTDTVRFSLNLRETAGRSVTLDAPALVSLVQQMGPDSKAAAINRYAKYAFGLDDKKFDEPQAIPFTKGQSRTLAFRLSDFPGPGKYEAKLQFGFKDATPISKAVTLYVRENWTLAAIAIGLGVLVSYSLRRWVSREQPRLELLKEATRLAPEVDAALRTKGIDATEKGLVIQVGGLLTELLSRISQGRKGADTAAIDVMGIRIAATRSFLVVRALVRQQPANVATEFLTKLEAARAVLTDPNADLTALKAQESAIRAIPDQVAAKRNELAAAGAQMGGGDEARR